MTVFRNLPIRRKLTIVIMATSTLALLFSLVGLLAYDLVSVREAMTRELVTLERILASNSAAAIMFNDPRDAEQTLSALSSRPTIVCARIFDREGAPFASYVRRTPPLETSADVRRLAPSWGNASRGKDESAAARLELPNRPPVDGDHFTKTRLTLTEPIIFKAERIGAIYLAADTSDLQNRLRQYAYMAGMVLVASLLLALMVSNVLQRVVSSPIQHLAAVAEGVVREQNYAIRAEKTGADETGMLIDAFNQMLAQIQAQDAELRSANELLERRVEERTRELRASQMSLEANLALVEATLEATTDAILVVDNAGRLMDFNQNFVTLWGVSPETLEGRDVQAVRSYMLSLVSDPTAYMATMDQLSSNPDTESFDIVSLKDGRTIERYSRAQRTAGTSVGRVWSYRDVTERLRAEQEIRTARDAAEAAARAKSEFLANMSHEIRTPMNGIIGMTDLALDTELTPEQREFLTMVKVSADSLLSVINDILDFSKIEAGKMDLDEIDFSLRDCLSDTMRSLALRADAKELELVCHVAWDVPDAFFGDPHRLRQVLINLVGNAVKFTDHGEIVVGVDVTSVVDDEVELQFSVKDTGPGIPEERKQVIFDAFVQADSSTTRKHGGTGLGLTISSKLVAMLGGRIWVESMVGLGSIFYFTVRLTRSRVIVTQHSAEPKDVEDLRVLIVDDNSTNRRILAEMLRNWRMEPTAVADGVEALAILEKASNNNRPYSLVLLDGKMPNMDGFRVAEEIHRRGTLVGPAIMMLSSAGQSGAIARCRRLGIVEYLAKPIKQSELLDAILRAVGSDGSTETPQIEQPGRLETNGGQGLSILVTEDNEVNQRLAVRLLEKRGHRVSVAANGKEALAAVAREHFDVILMDVQMPIMDGFEATAEIRRSEAALGRRTPIVAMTAHAMIGDRERCIAAGMDGYVSKPLRVDELLDAITAVVNAPVMTTGARSD
ncbi:MAG: response regulator [Capsulimonadaceae bacterium]|nr:response regulator [Capsulimonadaceae bacterium]